MDDKSVGEQRKAEMEALLSATFSPATEQQVKYTVSVRRNGLTEIRLRSTIEEGSRGKGAVPISSIKAS